jgi:uncharacterized protein (TIGR02145 family)
MKKATIALLLICVAAFAQQKGIFTDPRDGKKYKYVKIGSQTWMAENLNYDAKGSKCYGEGGEVIIGWNSDEDTPITGKLSDAEIRANCTKYGRLYDWDAAVKACPSGWHLSSNSDWKKLEKTVGSSKAAKKLRAKSGWGNDGNGTDDFGFSALPGGYGNSDGSFDDVGNDGNWWSANEDGSDSDANRKIGGHNELFYWYNYGGKSDLGSVRCVQD